MSREPVDVRRLAQRQALQTREAARLADCLKVLMRRAGVDPASAIEIAKALRIKAADLDVKAFGRIESRKGTKPTGHPLLEGRALDLLYLDESGSVNFSSGLTVFAVGGVAMSAEAAMAYESEANSLKMSFFGSRDITFHEPMIRKHDKEFHFGGDRAKQAEFDLAFAELVERTDFVAFGAAVRTKSYAEEFLAEGLDPYLPHGAYELAITLLLERYVDFIANRAGARSIGRVHFESIGAKEDAERQLTYAELLLYGTQFVSERQFCGWLETGCRFSPKTGTSAAELADLVAREVFEWVRSDCTSEPIHWQTLKRKFYGREDSRRGKFGLKVFPDYDIRDRIEAHRNECDQICGRESVGTN